MAALKGEVTWYDKRVILATEAVSEEALAAIAAQIEGQAKINIVANDQVDTGFLLNSIYWKVGRTDTYASTWGSGEYDSQRRVRAPQADLGSWDGVVAVGAEYAIYQELLIPFLIPAVYKVASDQGLGVKVEEI